MGTVHVQISVQSKPWLFVADLLELLGLQRLANRAVDRSLLVETITHDG